MCEDDLDLEQLLADPLVRLVMASDAVDEGQIRQLARRARLRRWQAERLAAPGPPTHGGFGCRLNPDLGPAVGAG